MPDLRPKRPERLGPCLCGAPYCCARMQCLDIAITSIWQSWIDTFSTTWHWVQRVLNSLAPLAAFPAGIRFHLSYPSFDVVNTFRDSHFSLEYFNKFQLFRFTIDRWKNVNNSTTKKNAASLRHSPRIFARLTRPSELSSLAIAVMHSVIVHIQVLCDIISNCPLCIVSYSLSCLLICEDHDSRWKCKRRDLLQI